MKKLCILLALCTSLTMTTVFADKNFSDLPNNHWAYGVVQQLVNSGRINGYPDGSFQPDNQVTRWEFAKMAGGNPDIVTEPNRASTRDEAAAYLWELAGKPAADAPSVITKKSVNPQAVAWCYTYGIMQGDDGLNLRLNSTLSRAEATALIVRAEQGDLKAVDFKDSIKAEIILKRVWDSVQSGIDYKSDATITNGQLARVALKIGSELSNINYSSVANQTTLTGEYAKDVVLVCRECLGEDKATDEFMNSPANIQDAVALLSFYSMRQSVNSIKVGSGTTYSDVAMTSPIGKMALAFAYYNGIRLYSTDKLNADARLTLKDASCILLQLDEIVGLNKSYGKVHSTPLMKEEYPYPSNAADYPYILGEIPCSVYETDIVDGKKPIDSYEYATNFSMIMTKFLEDVAKLVPSSVKAEWTFYPSLVVKAENEVYIRAGLKIVQNDNNLTLNEIFKQNKLDKAYTGGSYIVDITTGTPIYDITVDTDKYCIIRAFDGKD